MKRLLLTFAIAAACFQAAAQDFESLFDNFSKDVRTEYSVFQSEVDQSFSGFLRQSWKEFEIFAGIQRPERPKPAYLPKATATSSPAGVELFVESPAGKLPDSDESVNPEADDLEEDTSIEPPTNEIISVEPGQLSTVWWDFYNVCDSILIPDDIAAYKMRDCSQEQISIFWDFLSYQNCDIILNQIYDVSNNLGLSGWSLYAWIDAISGDVFSGNNEKQVFKSFILNCIGGDVRMAVMDGVLTVLAAFEESVYRMPFCEISGKKYYLTDDLSPKHTLKTYDSLLPFQHKPFSLVQSKQLRLYTADSDTMCPESRFSRYSTVFKDTITISVNQRHIDLYSSFPQMDAEVYARSAVPAPVSDKLVSFVKPKVFGLSSVDAVQLLLNYLQYDFDYAIDSEQFGFEKPFFVEENYFYPFNDCEDRAILFSFLVREVLGLDVVLLDYPNHVAAAVCFGTDDVQGDYFNYRGKKYIVCDPTYIGAPVGMTMEGYQNQRFKVIELTL